MLSYMALINDDSKQGYYNTKSKNAMKLSIKHRCLRLVKLAKENLTRYCNDLCMITANHHDYGHSNYLKFTRHKIGFKWFARTYCDHLSSSKFVRNENSLYSWDQNSTCISDCLTSYADHTNVCCLCDDSCSVCRSHSACFKYYDNFTGRCSLCWADFAANTHENFGYLQDYAAYSDHGYLCTESTCLFVAKMTRLKYIEYNKYSCYWNDFGKADFCDYNNIVCLDYGHTDYNGCSWVSEITDYWPARNGNLTDCTKCQYENVCLQYA